MIRCTNCGKELADGSKFCDGCGAKQQERLICPSCGAQNEPDNTFCHSCGASVKTVVAPPQPVPVTRRKRNVPKKAIIFSAIGVVVVVAILVPILLIFGGEETENSFAFYLKDGNMYFSDLGQGGEPIRITSNLVDEDRAYAEADGFDYKTKISEDGKYIFFPDRFESGDDWYNLYYRELGNTEAASVKIDSDVRSYWINDNATIVTYRKGSESNLYQYKLADGSKNKIGSEVYFYYVSDDGKKVIYRNSEDDLYFVKDGEKVKIAGEVSYIERYTDDFTTLYYFKDEALYKYANGEKTKIVSDVSSVLNIYDSGEIYYVTSREEEHCLMDYIEDDMAEADAAITAAPTTPDYPTMPTRSDYDSYDEFTVAYEAYYRECERIQEEYYAAKEAYWDKRDRDELRDDLSGTKISQTKYSLWFYDGTKAELITDEYFLGYNYEYHCASETPVIAYKQNKQSTISKSIKLSSVDSVTEVKDLVDEGTSFEYEACAAVKGTAKTLVGENATVTWFLVNNAGTMIYYADNVDNGYGDLYRVAVDDGAVGKPELYDSDVNADPGRCRYLDDSTLVYFKDYSYEDGGDMYIGKRMVDSGVLSRYWNSNNSGEFYYYSDYNYDKDYGTLKFWDGKKSVTIADDAFYSRISEGHVLYGTDYNDDRENCTLYIYDGKNSTKIADDVYSFDVLPDGRVLYLYDYSIKYHKGELYEWNGGKAKKIDDDVVYLFSLWH